jgi:hypothetical protein
MEYVGGPAKNVSTCNPIDGNNLENWDVIPGKNVGMASTRIQHVLI